MNLIKPFDPWRSKLCTCPAKLTFNPYTGCDHNCIYCYATSYIPKFHQCKPKKDLILRLEKEATQLKCEVISIANSSDPYPNQEAKTGLTRKCLEILARHNCKIQIITKSNLVARDIDLLKKVPSMVSMTITTDDDKTAKLLEPNAPSPSERLEALRQLVQNRISTAARIDPIIPYLNDTPEDLVKTLAEIGVEHITASTYKVKPDNWQRFSTALSEIAEKLKPLYFKKGEKIGGYIYLPRDLRLRLMKTAKELAEKHRIKFGTCREGLTQLNTAACDGSWLMETKLQ